MKHTALIAAGACAMLVSCKTVPADRFAQADLNRDGRLTRGEVSDYMVTTIFVTRDANNDKKLTKAEWVADGAKAGEKTFAANDKNKDGVVTLEEALAHSRKTGLFDDEVKAADTNKDGTLSRAEVETYYAKKEGPMR